MLSFQNISYPVISIVSKTINGKNLLLCNAFDEFCEFIDTPDLVGINITAINYIIALIDYDTR